MSEPGELFELRMAVSAEKVLARLPEKAAIALVEFALGPLRRHPRRVDKPLRGEQTGRGSARRGPYRLIYEIDDANHIVRCCTRTTAPTCTGRDRYHPLTSARPAEPRRVRSRIERVGIEVKPSATVRSSNVADLRVFEEIAGDCFRRGIVLYIGNDVVAFGPKLIAAPVSTRWS